jgi:hypothetical protein
MQAKVTPASGCTDNPFLGSSDDKEEPTKLGASIMPVNLAAGLFCPKEFKFLGSVDEEVEGCLEQESDDSSDDDDASDTGHVVHTNNKKEDTEDIESITLSIPRLQEYASTDDNDSKFELCHADNSDTDSILFDVEDNDSFFLPKEEFIPQKTDPVYVMVDYQSLKSSYEKDLECPLCTCTHCSSGIVCG